MTSDRDEALISDALGARPAALTLLAGGCVATVYRVQTTDGRVLAAKVDAGPEPTLDVESCMLEYLRGRCVLRVPGVVSASPRVLLMEFIEHSGGASRAGLVELAEGLAELHGVTGRAYGFGRDTLIGPLRQPNEQDADWRSFYAERRVRHFARVAFEAGRLGAALRERCERAADRIKEWIADDEAPTLVHGDLWSGNVLWRGGRVAGLIDPAVHYADREVELAFMDLFGSFGPEFWARYHAFRPIRAGFWEVRRHAYRLYPLLVHVRLFGGSYGGALSGELDALGVP